MTNPNEQTVRARVESVLTSEAGQVRFGQVRLAQPEDGDFFLRNQSAAIFVKCWSMRDDGLMYVTVKSPVLFGVKPTPELFEHIALNGDVILGHLTAVERDDLIDLYLWHTLVGDDLNERELFEVVGVVGALANTLDDDLKERFGGERTFED